MPSLAARLAAALMLLMGQVRRVSRTPEPSPWIPTPQLVDQYGYVVEEYHVTTEDGYVLTLHRMPPRALSQQKEEEESPMSFWRLLVPWDDAQSKGSANVSHPPVMVQHGLMGSSADWTLPGPTRGLPYILVDEGYDVWLGNTRGNIYSRNHTTLHPVRDKQKFWNFSWHEMGVYDLPTCIEHILRVTGQKRLFYIGYSQGTTAFFVMGSERPDMCPKVRAMLAMAPVAFMSHVRSPLIRMAARFDGMLTALVNHLGMHELVPHSEFLEGLGATICRSKAVYKDVCTNLLFLMAGYSSKHLNSTLLPLIMGHTPAGAAMKQLMHYGQEINSAGRFRKFDYGLRNPEVYGCPSPPDYVLSRVEVPVALFHSRNDWLAATQDVMKLYEHLPMRIGMFPIEDPEFTHLDFMWALQSRELVYDRLLRVLQRY
ncbi:lipase 3-like [Schistocerca serialis cubense]|uniref:lipase 3-like n=1 Tax=Schistocerca serialis cubense TaxID=2023355 RepID=UPI00214F0642|nr:lipase 3-like [Schistocerca serialis cubense]